jgi:hypothetical protein
MAEFSHAAYRKADIAQPFQQVTAAEIERRVLQNGCRGNVKHRLDQGLRMPGRGRA